jgi:hypothetical protein
VSHLKNPPKTPEEVWKSLHVVDCRKLPILKKTPVKFQMGTTGVFFLINNNPLNLL